MSNLCSRFCRFQAITYHADLGYETLGKDCLLQPRFMGDYGKTVKPRFIR